MLANGTHKKAKQKGVLFTLRKPTHTGPWPVCVYKYSRKGEWINMEIEEILNCFEDPNGKFPREALYAALKQQKTITPYLLSILKKTISNYALIDGDQIDYIFPLYLLSKFREKKAFPYILALASLPGKWPEKLLGDCITESLASFIVSTFNDDLSLIKKLVENKTLNIWSRAAALKSLLGLVVLQELRREELIDYIRSLFHSPLADDKEFATRLVAIADDLYPEELMTEITDAFERDNVDSFYINKKRIEQTLSLGKEPCLLERIYNDSYHLPIDDVEKKMQWISVFQRKQEKSNIFSKHNTCCNIDYEHFIPIERNNSCSCGSGKKFKKCCLN